MQCFHDGRGRLEGCELWGNEFGGVEVKDGADPWLAACTIRDHNTLGALGLLVRGTARGAATVADCVFARNFWGDVVRR